MTFSAFYTFWNPKICLATCLFGHSCQIFQVDMDTEDGDSLGTLPVLEERNSDTSVSSVRDYSAYGMLRVLAIVYTVLTSFNLLHNQ